MTPYDIPHHLIKRAARQVITAYRRHAGVNLTSRHVAEEIARAALGVVLVPDPTMSSGLTAEERADQQPRQPGERPCSTETCPLRYAHRGPCAPPDARQSPTQRAAGVLQRDGAEVVMPVTRKMLYAAFDVMEIARDLHTLHADDPAAGGSCGSCEFHAGFLLGRIIREHP